MGTVSFHLEQRMTGGEQSCVCGKRECNGVAVSVHCYERAGAHRQRVAIGFTEVYESSYPAAPRSGDPPLYSLDT